MISLARASNANGSAFTVGSSLARAEILHWLPASAGAQARLGRASDTSILLEEDPPREEWERALREEYAAERRCDEDLAAALRVRTRS